jgi:Flp pilus assembly protein TadG
MKRRPGICRRFAAADRGVAAIEFAIILPVLLIMLLATFDAGRAIAIYMKVRSATYTLAAITNQYSMSAPIQSADMQASDRRRARSLSERAGRRHHHASQADKLLAGDGKLELFA